MHKTIFISDLHLDSSQPAITGQFLALLQSCNTSVDALYILGDFFEAWIGDDDQTPLHKQIIQALHQATQRGLKIYFMRGNRDFLIGKRFARETGCQLLGDEEKITLYGQTILLMHGDTLCTSDIAYLKARKRATNPLLKTLFLLLPLSIRQRIANRLRQKSVRYTETAPKEIMDVTQQAVEDVMQKHGVTILIHGHTHRPNQHQFKLNQATATRWVLGAWHNGGNLLTCLANGAIEYRQLP